MSASSKCLHFTAASTVEIAVLPNAACSNYVPENNFRKNVTQAWNHVTVVQDILEHELADVGCKVWPYKLS